jgi:hypothetical protein
MEFNSVIELAFASKELSQKSIKWEINENWITGSDHVIVYMEIHLNGRNLVENPMLAVPFNLEKVDWGKFRENLLSLEKEYEWDQLSEMEENLEKGAELLETIIKLAAEESIPKRKNFLFSKPWWNEAIENLRKDLAGKKRQWKHYRTDETWQEFRESRNEYFSEIKKAKSTMWNIFLEKAKGKEIFKAFTYTKNRKVERIPIIEYEKNSEKKKAKTFNEKCDTFLTTLFTTPPRSNSLN